MDKEKTEKEKTESESFEVEVPQEVHELLSSRGWRGLRLDSEGRWYYGDEPVTHERLAAFLLRSVRPTKDGGWAVKAGKEVVPVEVEDTAYFVRNLKETSQGVVLELSDGTSEILDPDTLVYEGTGRLYCKVKGGRWRARFLRRAYNEVVTRIEEGDDGVYVVELGGRRIRLLAREE